ncbi:uncharacterized protein BJ171DRAFT_511973 [Polychytrium aggregatum]|uniref:uncharacterized protein n=1 Tax=Polychytrium aggregatum TaxID=110093 RepID=UPI0022FF1F6A|nr:uncharacterized protein BJ171DRAFT_511973 [Polychytrium aggregatum]KAI9202795.1 hypothetical protein BJ171DRAFT_511973 [Polychytrium aggregatum]
MGTFYVVLSGLVLILTSGTLTEKSLMSVTLLLIFVCVLLGVKVMDSRMTARWGVLVDEESLVESAS